jgi:hypothetical protein
MQFIVRNSFVIELNSDVLRQILYQISSLQITNYNLHIARHPLDNSKIKVQQKQVKVPSYRLIKSY